jgi:hypothetical protein
VVVKEGRSVAKPCTPKRGMVADSEEVYFVHYPVDTYTYVIPVLYPCNIHVITRQSSWKMDVVVGLFCAKSSLDVRA